jgi:hypothetical protein
VIAIRRKADINTLQKMDASELQMNGDRAAAVQTQQAAVF